MSTTTITREEVLNRIAIRSPYYGLDNLHREGDKLYAEINVEQPLEMEVSPITAAEAARHLAILGSCVVGISNSYEGMNFYLAYKAQLLRKKVLINDSRNKRLHVMAQVKEINKRDAVSYTEIKTQNGEKIFSLEVGYYVLPKKVFERQYKNFRKDMRKTPRNREQIKENERDYITNRRNFYREIFPIEVPVIKGHQIRVSLGEISPEHCMGHFPLYPSLPVAFLAYQKIYIAGLLLQHILKKGKIKYVVKETLMDAKQLLFAGKEVFIIVKYLKERSDSENFVFNCVSITDGKICVDLILTLSEVNCI